MSCVAGVRTVLVLDEDARPAVLQSCHPRGDSRFLLQTRRGGLVKIYDSVLMSGVRSNYLLSGFLSWGTQLPWKLSQAVMLSDLYSERSQFESRSGHWLYWLRVFLWFSSVFPHKCRDSSLKLARTAYFYIVSNSSLIILLFDIPCFLKKSLKLKTTFPPPSSSFFSSGVVLWLPMHCLPPKLEVCGKRMIFFLLSIRAVMFCLE